jgi:hypothetical protein
VILAGVFAPRGPALADTNITGNITADTTWTTASSTFVIQNDISINSGVTLTIDPGVTVKFKATSTTLYVYGTLSAIGTASSSIYFTSYKDDSVGGDTDGVSAPTQAGNWDTIYITSTGTVNLGYSSVRYGGSSSGPAIYNYGGTLDVQNSVIATTTQYGIWHSDGATTIATSTFNGNGKYGVYAYPSDGDVSITGSTFYDNATAAGYFGFGSGLTLSNSGNANSATGAGKRGFVMTGTVNTNTTWQADGLPYIISGGLYVDYGNTLTINPGTVVKFENSSANIQVGGTLTATQGANPAIVNIVYFTSIKDDTVGGDTDASATTTPASGDWGYISTGSGAITLEHSFVGYGGNSSYYGNLYNNGGTINISTSTISNAKYNGIYHAYGTTNVRQSVFRNNESMAFKNTTYSTSTAINNYWGNVSGPYNAKYNPSGTGNAVSDYVSFIPWLGMSTTTDKSIAAVNGIQLRWATTSPLLYESEWDNAVSKWNELTPIILSEATSTVDLTVEEEDLPEEAWTGRYYFNDDYGLTIGLNKPKLAGRDFNQIQHTCMHELGHSLGLLHSYWENIMYLRNTYQVIFGPQDTVDYHSLWGY